jgi:Mg2+/Co2+ transporter CorB
MSQSPREPEQLAEGTLISHLLELRTRLMRAVVAVLLVFIPLVFFANDLFTLVARPLIARLPEGTSLNTQLLNFQRQRRRVAFVVDEYGDVQGLVTLEDLLEEIVGEFTSDKGSMHKDVHRERGDSFIVNASASVRTLNRKMGWTLPTSGPRTLNGLILEYLETIPEPGTSLRISDYAIDVLQTGDNAVKTVRLRPIKPPADSPTRSSEGDR